MYGTTSTNPGAQSNFYYVSGDDELTVENIQAEGNVAITGNLTVSGTISGSGISSTISDAGADTKTGGSITLNDNVDLYFGTGDDIQFYYTGSEMRTDFNDSVNWNFRNTSNVTVATLTHAGNLTVNDLTVNGATTGISGYDLTGNVIRLAVIIDLMTT